MKISYVVFTNNYFLSDFVHPKNIRYAFIASNLNEEPTSNLDFDIEIDNDFYNHINYYKIIEYDNDITEIINLRDLEHEYFGPHEKPFIEDFLRKQNCFYFCNKNSYDSLTDAAIAVQEWIRTVCNNKIKEMITKDLGIQFDD